MEHMEKIAQDIQLINIQLVDLIEIIHELANRVIALENEVQRLKV